MSEVVCFQRGLFLGNSVDDEIEEELAEINLQRVWNGRVRCCEPLNFLFLHQLFADDEENFNHFETSFRAT